MFGSEQPFRHDLSPCGSLIFWLYAGQQLDRSGSFLHVGNLVSPGLRAEKQENPGFVEEMFQSR
jgi:hypothetical protein